MKTLEYTLLLYCFKKIGKKKWRKFKIWEGNFVKVENIKMDKNETFYFAKVEALVLKYVII